MSSWRCCPIGLCGAIFSNRLGTLAYLESADQAGSFFQQVHDKAMMHGDRERSVHALNNLGRELDENGLALLGLVAHHPASDFDTRRALLGALAALGIDPNDPRVLTGMEKGKSLDVDLAVNSLLTKFGES